MTSWRRRLRRARLALTIAFSSLVIAAAVLVGLAQLLLPFVARYPDRVAAFLSERVHRPVSLDAVDAAWERTGPVLRLSGVHIASASPGQPPLVIPEAELALDFSAWAKKNRRWNEFRLRGLDLRLVQDAEGEWQLEGFSGAGSGADNPLLALGALVLVQTRVTIVDPAHDIDLALVADELRLLNWGSEHRVLALVRGAHASAQPVQLVARYDDVSGGGELYLGGGRIDLATVFADTEYRGNALVSGRGRVQFWASWRGARIDSVHVALDLADIAVKPSDSQLAAIPGFGRLAQLVGVLRWRREHEGWQLDVGDFAVTREAAAPVMPSAFSFAFAREGKTQRYEIVAPHVELATLAMLASFSDALPVQLRQWLMMAAPHGRLDDVAASYVGDADFDLHANLTGISFSSAAGVPGIDQLNAHLFGDAQALLLELPDQAPTITFPSMFRQPFLFSHFGDAMVAAFRRAQGGWHVETDAFAFEGMGYGGEFRGGVDFPNDGTRPLLDLQAVVTHGMVPAAKLFWPNSMSRSAVTWLDRALVAGRIVSGRALVRGDLDDWPFRNLAGRFDAVAQIEDLTLDYHPGWPRAEQVSAIADFSAIGMHVEADAGEVLGVRAASAVADIRDFDNTELGLAVQGSGKGAELLALLNATPIGRRNADALAGLKVGGSATIDFRYDLPIKDRLAPGRLDGKLQLSDADLDQAKWKIHFTDATGPIRFDEHGLFAGPLSLKHLDHSATLSLAVGDAVADSSHDLEATFEGHLPVEAVFAGFEMLKPYWAKFPGSSDWRLALAITGAPPGAASPIRLTAESDLVGTTIDLPAPLNKSADDALPVRLSMDIPAEDSTLTLSLGKLAHLRAHLPGEKPLALALKFGEVAPTATPADGLVVSGVAEVLDLSGWIAFGVGNDAGTLRLHGVDVSAQQARVFERELGQLDLRVTVGVEATDIVMAGDVAQGQLHIPSREIGARGITAEFAKLHLPAPLSDASDDASVALQGVAPASLPPLHIRVDDLRLGEGKLGMARLESAPSAQGMHIVQLEAISSNMQMHATGDWIGDAATSRSNFAIDLSSDNFGHMLDALGYAGVVDGGETLAKIQASWLGTPSSFALAKLNGALKISVAEGRILDVEPGVGRLFGLLSFREIPRRLALDFGDFFRSGMTFKSISGDFDLRDGNAITQNLHIASPSADIRISGRTGLKARDYDQQMIVVPRVSGALPVVGAIAGGPAGAAAGLAVQTLFNRAINSATTARYHVTGSWEQPNITLIAREGGRKSTDAKPLSEKEK